MCFATHNVANDEIVGNLRIAVSTTLMICTLLIPEANQYRISNRPPTRCPGRFFTVGNTVN
jgi:hypothetical protein